MGHQCINCGHVEAPSAQDLQCERCGGFELHIFPVELEAEQSERVYLTPLGAARLRLTDKVGVAP